MTRPERVSRTTVYTAPGADPGELLAGPRFTTAEDLRGHLFDALFPALIEQRPPSRNSTELFRPRRRHNPAKVRAWLSYLAHHLNQIPTDDGATATRDPRRRAPPRHAACGRPRLPVPPRRVPGPSRPHPHRAGHAILPRIRRDSLVTSER